jgi:hypothetical protein
MAETGDYSADCAAVHPIEAERRERRLEEGLPSRSRSFAAVIDGYIAYRERVHRHGKTSAGMLRQIIRVSKFWRDSSGLVRVLINWGTTC